ncbi:hypothetical protein [Nocardia pseudobrasiliensis]|uniref:Uncharacterized protein n=1 Tax=Nocardia pseudobrasiliensis TaxID=45979 RepID=A0A370IF29_9NOCA|nr:hypothetical protein [Nocardia pseudobrasiliensis]RDI69200.1 hypothetical protein DFR76_101738 [Nocardia pseudobrasiliensis]
MTTLWIVLGAWIVCSIPVALLLARMFRSPQSEERDESHHRDDEFTPGQRRGRL